MGYSHAQVKRPKDYDWRLHLTRKKAKQGQRSRKRRSSAVFVHERRP